MLQVGSGSVRARTHYWCNQFLHYSRCGSGKRKPETHETALPIAARYGYRIHDALIAASALEAECGTLYSEDFADGEAIGGRLTIRNPFTPRGSD